MLRLFQLRDWTVLNRLNKSSVPLNATRILLNQYSPVQAAVLTQATRANYPTYVWRPSARNMMAFAQCEFNEQKTQAYLLWMGSAYKSFTSSKKRAIHPEIWQPFFDRWVIELGDAGVQNIVAEVPVDSDEQLVLKEAGFVIYGRQHLWELPYQSYQPNDQHDLLRPYRRTNDWDIELLYCHSVPNMIRMVEPHPTTGKNGLVLYEGNNLTGYIHTTVGCSAKLMNLCIHLSTEQNVSNLVGNALRVHPPTPKQPVFCAVRNYQEWVEAGLQKQGFAPVGSQVVMVKHIIQPIRHTLPVRDEQQTKGRAAMTSPTIIPRTDVPTGSTYFDTQNKGDRDSR